MGGEGRGFDLLAVDIDGTLLDPAGKLTPRTVAAVRRAVDAGIRVVAVTGRSWLQARPILDRLELDETAAVVGGALIRHTRTDDVFAAETFEPALAHRLIHELVRRRLAVVTTVHTPAPNVRSEYLILRGDPPDALDEAAMSKRPEVYRFVDSPDELDRHTCLRITVTAGPDAVAEVRRLVHERFAGEVRCHLVGAPGLRHPLLEMHPAHVHKWFAVRATAERMGIPRERIAAVGDEANDLEMVAEAGLGAAMGNAIPALKEVADVVLEPNSDDGLARFVESLLDG